MQTTEPKTTGTEPETTRTEPKTTRLERDVAGLEQRTAAQLRARYMDIFGEPPSCSHKQRLIRGIAWRLQSVAEGDLSERARKRAAQLARDEDVRVLPPPNWKAPGTRFANSNGHSRDSRLPAVGTVLKRDFHGQTIEVEILEDGFRHDGAVYSSLSAVARKITGTQWNGFVFFAIKTARKGKR